MSNASTKVGDLAPDFTLSNQSDEIVTMSDLRGKPVVLFFYPADDTEGCTVENREFSDLADAFDELGSVLLGISPDTVKSHRKFIDKHGLRLQLLADPERHAVEAYGLWRQKKLYGREFMGLVRTSFIVASTGRIVDILPATRIKGHAGRVLDALKQHLLSISG